MLQIQLPVLPDLIAFLYSWWCNKLIQHMAEVYLVKC